MTAAATPVLTEVPAEREYEGDALPVNLTLRRVTVIFRLLGWAWMALLVATTLATDDETNAAVALGALGLATLWTLVTLAAARSHDSLSSPVFVVADGLVAVAIMTASSIAGAEHFFHGGYPMSWLGIAAYAWGFRGAVPGSLVFVAEQALVDILDDRNDAVPIAGSVTFFVFAVVAGWGYSAIRDGDRARMRTEAALAVERQRLAVEQEARARLEVETEVANRLHDSVLQTLLVLLRDSDDGEQVRRLARRMVRELRGTIDAYRSPYSDSVRAALRRAAGEVEDLHQIQVDPDVEGDAEMSPVFRSVVGATREALQNAAKHSGASKIFLTARVEGNSVRVYVRDNGAGFVPDLSTSGGLFNSVISPIEEVGGEVEIKSAPGEGTEVIIAVAGRA